MSPPPAPVLVRVRPGEGRLVPGRYAWALSAVSADGAESALSEPACADVGADDPFAMDLVVPFGAAPTASRRLYRASLPADAPLAPDALDMDAWSADDGARPPPAVAADAYRLVAAIAGNALLDWTDDGTTATTTADGTPLDGKPPADTAPPPAPPAATRTLRSFGARGDGVTDDAPALQAAFDHAAATGDALLGEPGAYVARSSVRVGTGTTLLMADGCALVRGFASGGTRGLLANHPFATRIARVRIVGGTLRAEWPTRTGRMLCLHCDDLVVERLLVDGFYGLDALFVGGDRVRLEGVRTRHAQHVGGAGAIRVFAGRDVLCHRCDVESGDDCLGFVPSAGAYPYGNQSVERGRFVRCRGTSHAARLAAVVLEDGGPDALTNAARDVAFYGVRGAASLRAVGIDNVSSAGGEVRGVRVRDLACDLATDPGDAGEAVRVLARAGPVADVFLEDVRLTNVPCAALGVLAYQQLSPRARVSDVRVSRLRADPPRLASGFAAVAVKGCDGFSLEDSSLGAGWAACVVVDADAAGVASTAVALRRCALGGVRQDAYGVSVRRAVGCVVEACTFAPAAGATDARGVAMGAVDCWRCAVRSCDFTALPGRSPRVLFAPGRLNVAGPDSAGLAPADLAYKVPAARRLPFWDRTYAWTVLRPQPAPAADAPPVVVAAIGAPPAFPEYAGVCVSLSFATPATVADVSSPEAIGAPDDPPPNLALAASTVAAVRGTVLRLAWDAAASLWRQQQQD